MAWLSAVIGQIIEIGLALLTTASIPTTHWDNAFQTDCHSIPQSILKKQLLLKFCFKPPLTIPIYLYLAVNATCIYL